MDVTLQQFHSVAFSIKGLLIKHNIYFQSYPYSTAPRDIFLFPQLKKLKKQIYFRDAEITQSGTEKFNSIPHIEYKFHTKCSIIVLDHKGGYLERNKCN